MLNRKPLKVIYYTDSSGETRYRICAANGHVLVPPESHAKSAAVRAFRRLVEELAAGNYVEIDHTDEERRRKALEAARSTKDKARLQRNRARRQRRKTPAQ